MKDYHINIFYSEDDEGYIADIPDLALCSAFGRTPAEALAELETAKRLWLEAAPPRANPSPNHATAPPSTASLPDGRHAPPLKISKP